MLDDRPPPINNYEKDPTRKECTTLAQLRSEHCRLLCSYKSRIKKDASLNICTNSGKIPHDVKHLSIFPVHPTTLTQSDLWNQRTPSRSSAISRKEVQIEGEQEQHTHTITFSILIYLKNIYILLDCYISANQRFILHF